MAKRRVLRHKVTGAIFGWNPAMAKNPKVEEVELDLTKPQSKPDDKPATVSVKKAAPKKKAAKAPMTPLVADSEEELDELLAGLDKDGEDG
ncbi:MAG: hypothetical protein DRI24_01705 [Deltaproteobacteria bacterium]|nr:MAG: hypothetical protein DRI24_01705 [Deltaproteobacteria bacterium]